MMAVSPITNSDGASDSIPVERAILSSAEGELAARRKADCAGFHHEVRRTGQKPVDR